MNIIISLVLILSVIGITVVVYLLKNNKKDKLSFKESLDLTELPVVTFYNNGLKLNFLLDTGSNVNLLNKKLSEKLKKEFVNSELNVYGVGGVQNSVEASCCNMEITNGNLKFTDNFYLIDLEETFSEIKKSSGVQIHGILGSLFFNKYRYILDFNKMIAYVK
jgi:hypothetical protein